MRSAARPSSPRQVSMRWRRDAARFITSCADCGSSQNPGAADCSDRGASAWRSSPAMSKTHHDVRDALAECGEAFAKLVHVVVRSISVLNCSAAGSW